MKLKVEEDACNSLGGDRQ